jgi:hypothetical protein
MSLLLLQCAMLILVNVWDSCLVGKAQVLVATPTPPPPPPLG